MLGQCAAKIVDLVALNTFGKIPGAGIREGAGGHAVQFGPAYQASDEETNVVRRSEPERWQSSLGEARSEEGSMISICVATDRSSPAQLETLREVLVQSIRIIRPEKWSSVVDQKSDQAATFAS
jgi:hypothetical protein